MTTFRSFVDALEALSITGVTRTYTEGPPKSLNAPGDLPAQWVQLPRSEEGDVMVYGGFGGVFTDFTADLIIAVQAVGLAEGGQLVNFDDTVDMMDNVNAALIAIASCDTVAKSKHRWAIRQTIVQVAGNDYWAVVATVSGSG